MAKAPRMQVFEIGAQAIRAGWGDRIARIAYHNEASKDGALLVVELDAVECWESGEEIAVDDLGRLFDIVERECLARGLDAEFE